MLAYAGEQRSDTCLLTQAKPLCKFLVDRLLVQISTVRTGLHSWLLLNYVTHQRLQTYKHVHSFTYLGGAVTEVPDMSVEIARRPAHQAVPTKTLRPTESRALPQDPNGQGGDNQGPLVWMQYVDPSPGTLRQTPHRTRLSLASYHRGTAQETRSSDDFVQPCP